MKILLRALILLLVWLWLGGGDVFSCSCRDCLWLAA